MKEKPGWHWLEEGPWESREDADEFAEAEVCVPCEVVERFSGEWWIRCEDLD